MGRKTDGLPGLGCGVTLFVALSVPICYMYHKIEAYTTHLLAEQTSDSSVITGNQMTLTGKCEPYLIENGEHRDLLYIFEKGECPQPNTMHEFGSNLFSEAFERGIDAVCTMAPQKNEYPKDLSSIRRIGQARCYREGPYYEAGIDRAYSLKSKVMVGFASLKEEIEREEEKRNEKIRNIIEDKEDRER